jgi:hypothetical protein
MDGVTFPLFRTVKALQDFGAEDGRLGMLEWSEPVIFDRLRETYGDYVAEEEWVWRLARQHCRVWRALIAGDMAKFEDLRLELGAMLQALGLNLACVAAADAGALAELNEIVNARFQRWSRLAKGYRLALIELAKGLAPAGRAA